MTAVDQVKRNYPSVVGVRGLLVVLVGLAHHHHVVTAPERVRVHLHRVQVRVRVLALRLKVFKVFLG